MLGGGKTRRGNLPPLFIPARSPTHSPAHTSSRHRYFISSTNRGKVSPFVRVTSLLPSPLPRFRAHPACVVNARCRCSTKGDRLGVWGEGGAEGDEMNFLELGPELYTPPLHTRPHCLPKQIPKYGVGLDGCGVGSARHTNKSHTAVT